MPLIVIDTRHEMIIRRIWFSQHRVLIDTHARKLRWPTEWPEENPHDCHDIRIDEAGTPLSDPSYDRDAARRDALMDKDNKRKRDGVRGSQTPGASDPALAYALPRTHQESPVSTLEAVQRRIRQLEVVRPEPPETTQPPRRPLTILQRYTPPPAERYPGQASIEQALAADLPSPDLKRMIDKETRSSTPVENPWERDDLGPYQLRRDTVGWYKHRPADLAIINADPF
ncbi:hypothetical protein F4780DRAFT_743908 [Xylariomycetidae sp. FL0641]|nr:hypothetical protein F4780DRAFT_743908 [Xylariomycetidae sp. FL0641]